MRLAVFASGNGSNFETIVNVAQMGELKAEIALLVSDRPNCLAVKRADKAGVPVFTFQPKDFSSKEAFESMISEQLRQHQIDLVILAGYMRLIGKTLLQEYSGRIVNIHPSLLPAFPGKDAVGQALEYGVKVTGVTIHYVDEGMDTGPIIYQEAVDVYEDDNRDQIQQRIQAVEHRIYPKVIQRLVQTQKSVKEVK